MAEKKSTKKSTRKSTGKKTAKTASGLKRYEFTFVCNSCGHRQVEVVEVTPENILAAEQDATKRVRAAHTDHNHWTVRWKTA